MNNFSRDQKIQILACLTEGARASAPSSASPAFTAPERGRLGWRPLSYWPSRNGKDWSMLSA
jgi:hypothetical protein